MPRFRAKPVELEAFQLNTVVTIPAGRGRATQKGKAGDWLVTHADSRQEILTDAALRAGYELLGDNGSAPPAAKARRDVEPRKPAGRRGSSASSKRPKPTRASGTDNKIETVKAQYELGVPVATIAKRVGWSIAKVYNKASQFDWKRPPGPGVKGTAAKRAKAPAGEKLSGTVRCDHCQVMTEYDPCQHCHKKLTRKW